MSNLFSTYGTSLLFLLSIYGWGRVLAQISYKNNLPGWAFTCTLGITLLMFIGGVLNALNIANSDTLFSLLFIGIVLSILCHFLDYRPFNPQNKITRLNIIGNSSSLNFSLFFSRLLETIILLTVFIFLSAALMPTSSFNFHDDFHTYLVRPVRMLQTGTLGGNLFDIIGFDSLGTQSFFQAFTLLWNSNNTINAFDAIICFVLTAGIILELGCKLKINILFSLLAVVLFAAINPHYANISSLYSGALMLLAVTYAYVMLNDAFNSGNLRESIWASMPVALCLATLFSLKITFIFAFLLALSGNIIFSLFLTSSRKKAAITNSCCLAACIVFLLPWLSLYFEKYMKKIYFVFKDAAVPMTSSAAINNSLFSDTITKLSDNWLILLSNYDLFYGNSYRDYTTVILMLVIVSVTAMSMLRPEKGNSPIFPIIISIVIGALNYVLLSTYFTPRLIVSFHPETPPCKGVPDKF